ncbi:hypothetical protein LSCM1_04836 [Leishmania martiniquensis]|uniref:CW-type domain-containing protein n=1 Tax=Leishmania martiniquensis TaxID=1580590 RepID=A0A836H1X7_9TRYP|nr:hypothetical protein LSCM1_04836 [Leishmania martiniquensis]
MEWPLSRAPFVKVVVEEGDGDDVAIAEVHQLEAGHKGDVRSHEVDALQQSSQHPHSSLASLPASKAKSMQAVHAATPMWHGPAVSQASSSGCSDSNGQATHGLRLALTSVATTSAAGSSTHGTSSASRGTVPYSRTLQLRSTVWSPQATAETAVLSVQQPVPSSALSSRWRTLKSGAAAEGAETRMPSPSKRAAAAKHVGAARHPRSGRGRTVESPSIRVRARPVQQSEASASSTAATAPHLAISEISSSPLPPASSQEMASEAHRLAMQAARPPSLSVCFDWWMSFCYYDTHALFTSQSAAFEAPLRPVAGASASVFYAVLTRCFALWRREHWDSLVVLRGAGPADADKRRRGAAMAQRTVRDPALLEYANAVWYEGLRVQRLMAQLLLSGTRGSWSFEVGCLDALLTALGAPPSVEWPLCATPSGPATAGTPYRVAPGPPSDVFSAAGLSPTTRVTVTCKDATAALPPTEGLSIGVPTAARVLSLLHVLDVLWSTLPAATSFRMPVSEMEAPGYYRSIRDPVSLCQLYEEVFCGMTASTHRACVRQHAHMIRRVLEVLKRPVGRSGSGTALEDDVQSCFFSYAHLRERLATLKANCDEYNGGGSELSQQASALLRAGVKALRDAQAEEGRRTSSQAPGEDADEVRESAYGQEALLAGLDDWATQQPAAAGGLVLDDLLSMRFPPSEAVAVVPPNLRQALPIVQQTADDSSARGQDEGSRHTRVLRLPTATVKDVPVSVSASAAAPTLKDFWVQCDECNSWHKLATPLDPVPDTWTCGSLGLACSSDKKRRTGDRRATKKVAKRGITRAKTPAGKRRRVRDGENMDATHAAPSPVTAAPHRIGGKGNDSGGGDGDVPLVDMLPARVRALAVDAAVLQRRERSAPRKPRATRQRPKKPRVELSTRPSSSSSSGSSSRSSSPSNGDDDDDSSSSSSSRSDSSDSGSDSDSGCSDGESTAPSAQRIRPGLRQGKRSTVVTHKLPRSASTTSARGNSSVAAAATGRASGSGASCTALRQLAQAVATLEERPLQDNPFYQLEEIKRLEKRLSAIG